MLLKELKEQTNNLTDEKVFKELIKVTTIPASTIRYLPLNFKNILFIEKANKIHNNKYNYSKVLYTTSKNKVKISCPVHGSFEQIADHHTRGRGCTLCGRIETEKARILSTEEFIFKARKIHKNYNYNKVKYKRTELNVIITCLVHGDFAQTPHSHLSGSGCTLCGNERKLWKGPYKPEEPTLLYYIKIEKEGFPFLYKIGITSQIKKGVIKGRYSGEKGIILLIDEWLYSTGNGAYDKEQEILLKYKQFQYKGPPLLYKGGNTELFTKDVLDLDRGEI